MDESIGFAIRCQDEKTYTVVFSAETPLQVIELAPSRCQLDEIIYAQPGGSFVDARQLAPFRLLRNEFLNAGGLYYVGDFSARATAKVTSNIVISKEVRYSWEITDITNNYARTTAAMKRKYPGFATAASEDRASRSPDSPGQVTRDSSQPGIVPRLAAPVQVR
jgi:hypothetical protein